MMLAERVDVQRWRHRNRQKTVSYYQKDHACSLCIRQKLLSRPDIKFSWNGVQMLCGTKEILHLRSFSIYVSSATFIKTVKITNTISFHGLHLYRSYGWDWIIQIISNYVGHSHGWTRPFIHILLEFTASLINNSCSIPAYWDTIAVAPILK